MNHKDFLRLARYLNTVYRGGFSATMTRQNASVYESEYRTGKKSDILSAIVSMLTDDIEYLPNDIARIYFCLLETI